eukprot:COSAG06_NODE_1947_length_8003_cov_17.512146_1_plen_445_part_00
MDPEAADGSMGSLIKPEERAEDMGFTLLPEKEAYAEMSKRLLGGWTMLNEHCPISGFPLLRKDGVTWSVRCNMAVKSADEAPNATLAPAPAPSPPEPAPAPAPPTLAERLRQRTVPEFDEGEVDLRMPSAPEPAPSATTSGTGGPNGAVISSTEISAQLSDLLLKGWRMLEEECPVTSACPLMQQKSTGRKFSVAMQKFVDELGEDPAAAPAPAAVEASPEPAPTTSGTGGPNGAVISSTEISAQLSDLLLKGWRMLEEECPVTSACPLMQQKSTGRKFSVAMQKFVDELGEDPAAAPAPAPAPARLQRPVEVPQDEDEDEGEDEDEDEDDFLAQYRAQRLAEMQAASPQSSRPAPAPVPEPSRSSGAISAAPRPAASSNLSEDVSSVLEQASASLVKQIAAAESRLNGSEGGVSVSDAIALAQLIGASATALRQMQPVGGPLL